MTETRPTDAFDIRDVAAYAMSVARSSVTEAARQRYLHAPIVERQFKRAVHEMLQDDRSWNTFPGRLAVLEIADNGAIAAWAAYEFLRLVPNDQTYVWWNTKRGLTTTITHPTHLFHDLRCYDVRQYRLHTFKLFLPNGEYVRYV